MGLPQILTIMLLALGTGIALAKHGQPKDGSYSFFTSLISDAIWILLLYWGGFFQ